MNYWWVNQNQTFQHELNGGYMWSPKRNKTGARNQFYENMLLVRPGDLVFSFNKTRIPAIGQILSVARESPKPDEFGDAGAYWNSDGWRVDVQYQPICNAIRPKDLIEQLRPTLPEKYSPLQKNGDGLQSVYLAHRSDAMADASWEQEALLCLRKSNEISLKLKRSLASPRLNSNYHCVVFYCAYAIDARQKFSPIRIALICIH